MTMTAKRETREDLKPATRAWLEANPKVKLFRNAAGELVIRDVCGRCGGSGRYSFNMMDGDRCYGCGGCGKVYTGADKYVARIKRAEAPVRKRAAAAAAWAAMLAGRAWVSVDEVKTATADYARAGWVTMLIAIAYSVCVMAPWYAFLGLPLWNPNAPWPY